MQHLPPSRPAWHLLPVMRTGFATITTITATITVVRPVVYA
jgi:hypothetical protein